MQFPRLTALFAISLVIPVSSDVAVSVFAQHLFTRNTPSITHTGTSSSKRTQWQATGNRQRQNMYTICSALVPSGAFQIQITVAALPVMVIVRLVPILQIRSERSGRSSSGLCPARGLGFADLQIWTGDLGLDSVRSRVFASSSSIWKSKNKLISS